jgi:hypothetical protein
MTVMTISAPERAQRAFTFARKEGFKTFSKRAVWSMLERAFMSDFLHPEDLFVITTLETLNGLRPEANGGYSSLM